MFSASNAVLLETVHAIKTRLIQKRRSILLADEGDVEHTLAVYVFLEQQLVKEYVPDEATPPSFQEVSNAEAVRFLRDLIPEGSEATEQTIRDVVCRRIEQLEEQRVVEAQKKARREEVSRRKEEEEGKAREAELYKSFEIVEPAVANVQPSEDSGPGVTEYVFDYFSHLQRGLYGSIASMFAGGGVEDTGETEEEREEKREEDGEDSDGFEMIDSDPEQ